MEQIDVPVERRRAKRLWRRITFWSVGAFLGQCFLSGANFIVWLRDDVGGAWRWAGIAAGIGCALLAWNVARTWFDDLGQHQKLMRTLERIERRQRETR